MVFVLLSSIPKDGVANMEQEIVEEELIPEVRFPPRRSQTAYREKERMMTSYHPVMVKADPELK
jgi:CO/xanthine dehydrogenase FAD-binding subunit